MPIYEYRCSECGEKFEKLVRFSASASEVECPKCGARKADKLISAFSAKMSSAGMAVGSNCAPASSG
jgi:putative FmdB family regulatory protein